MVLTNFSARLALSVSSILTIAGRTIVLRRPRVTSFKKDPTKEIASGVFLEPALLCSVVVLGLLDPPLVGLLLLYPTLQCKPTHLNVEMLLCCLLVGTFPLGQLAEASLVLAVAVAVAVALVLPLGQLAEAENQREMRTHRKFIFN